MLLYENDWRRYQCDAGTRKHDQLVVAFKAVLAFALSSASTLQAFEVHELRCALRTGSDGKNVPQIIVALTQSRKVKAEDKSGASYIFRGGSTLVVDLLSSEVKYRIVKNINSENRKGRTAEIIRESVSDPLQALFFAHDRPEPFAVLHSLSEDGF